MTTREFALRNVGPGPDPFAFADLDADFAVCLLHRDYYCSNCRQQVRRVKARYEAFETRDAEVVSVLPEEESEATEWATQYALPFPVLADADHVLGDRFDQPTRYGLLGKVHDVIGRMPAVVILDLRGAEPEQVYVHRGGSPADRPTVDDLLGQLDKAAAGDVRTSPPDTAASDTAAETAANAPGTAAETDAGLTDAEAAATPADTAVTSTDAPPTGAKADPPVTDAEPGSDGGVAVATGTPTTDAGEELLDEPVAPTVAPDGVSVRTATDDDVMAVMQVLHGALLDLEIDAVREAIADGDVLVAEDRGWVVGALVLRDGHVEGVAVRRERRAEGIGSALVETAAEQAGTLTADFRSGVRSFWENLGFEIEERGGRLWGERDPQD